MSESVKLELGGKIIELPIFVGTENEKSIDITKLRGQSGGWVTLDSGYMNTGACTSSITYLDGEKGILRYRGYPIEELAEKSRFLEVSYLLLNGELPTDVQFKAFKGQINTFNHLPEAMNRLISNFPVDAHPMGVMSALTVALSAFYPQFNTMPLKEDKLNEVLSLMMGHIPIMAAQFYRHSQNLKYLKYDPDKTYAQNFLLMMFDENPHLDVFGEALDLLLILHADHEQNCSTSTVRLVGSSKANIFASIAGGVNALWGPSHGGANQSVIEMLEMIKADGGGHKKFLEKAKDKNNNVKLMGFGHRVYKNFDPRAKIIKVACDKVLNKLGINDPILDIAKGLEEEALRDPYFVERKLYPNVDFYSGIIYKAMGIPTDMFTAMFVLGRLPGWMAQWKEMVTSPMKIGRPRQIYTGSTVRHYPSK